MKASFFFKLSTILGSTILILSGCAAPVYVYPETPSYALHFEKNPRTLNCRQLNEARIQVSSFIDIIAEEQIEGASRSTPNFTAGVSISNPSTGKDFVGYRSEGVMPEVNEFRRLKVLLEEIQDLQILKCTRNSLEN
ncbi:MAG: hypothetical protein DBW94_06135 [Gammaproteobacteria bacterium]|nr:MAG: hypothetical protein DBW94_06135 [Gammaproteobacteria bacterium]|tara:strand:- start:597 stop:1007 length:411 start_codon:yes stop_codon:yes gene_type:complete